MIKKLFSAVILVAAALTAGAQTTPMPLNPNVKHGTLPNGLNYYILHNEEPKERANFYIAQKVGSTLEEPNQLGLAHFLEHMAFNGLTNYPGKSMLKYLESKGIRFGADINAYTYYDETVYNIDNVPTSDKVLMDSVLLVLHDWSGGILLEDSEIEAERGVILSEWRDRNDAGQRMRVAQYPKIYSEYQYQHTVIGDTAIIRTFPPEVIRAYYKKWYRPDQQGIVIVGDFDAAEMEKKVIDLFSTIPMPENAAERTYTPVSDNKEPIYFYFQDKEFQMPRITVYFKSDKTPVEEHNTQESYVFDILFPNLISTMINNRLEEYMQKPECKYAYAGVYFSDFMVSKTKDAFVITIIPKEDVLAGYDDALAIVAQACKTGFMQSEIERARDQIIAEYEKLYNERNNTKNTSLGQELCRHFIDNDPTPGIEIEYQIVSQVLSNVPAQLINQFTSTLLTDENQVITVAIPEKDGTEEIAGAVMTEKLANAIHNEYEAYVDEVITDPLVEKLPKPGKIKKVEAGQFGTTVMTLSNGAKVIIKPTDFKADEILFTAFKNGGIGTYEVADSANVKLISEAYELSKLGNFDKAKLTKYLAGKNIGLGYNLGRTVTSLEGQSTVKDLPTFMEVLYSTFTNVNPDETTYQTQIDKTKTILANSSKNPNVVFNNHISYDTYGGNPLLTSATVETLETANYPRMLDMFRNSLSNAADYTFMFVGNVNVDSIKPQIEQYIATLPSKGKKSVVKDITNIDAVSGQIKDHFMQPMQVPGTWVYSTIGDKNIPYSVENAIKIRLIGNVLSNIFTDTLREEEGGTYSPYAYASLNPYFNKWDIVYVFQTNDKQQDKLMARAEEELNKLLANGSDEEHFNKAKEAMMKQYEINVRSNKYWNNNLMLFERGFDAISNNKSAIENLTLADFNAFMKGLYNGNNRLQVIMQGVEEGK